MKVPMTAPMMLQGSDVFATGRVERGLHRGHGASVWQHPTAQVNPSSDDMGPCGSEAGRYLSP